ncbi:MAG: hypothetical protein QNJ68_15280 [Microcoleaceae cyanobacterium MO_207.B10]|nr:hypothetical protein [Microcoleaceae cyanobacterium MO_207.B10]
MWVFFDGRWSNLPISRSLKLLPVFYFYKKTFSGNTIYLVDTSEKNNSVNLVQLRHLAPQLGEKEKGQKQQRQKI